MDGHVTVPDGLFFGAELRRELLGVVAVPFPLHLYEFYLLLVVQSALGGEVELAGGWEVVANWLGY